MASNINLQGDFGVTRRPYSRSSMKIADIPNHVAASAESSYGYPMCRSWVCDFCHVATFPSYVEAARHETICKQIRGLIDHQNLNIVQSESFSLSIPDDENNLSDRQCFIRSHFIEAFIINSSHMSYVKGASKINIGQVGLRCKYCCDLPPRGRADRSVCFPTSISR